MTRAWTFLSVPDDRQYGGNRGYLDDPAGLYRYDSFVANCLRVRAGDLIFIRNRHAVAGMARIQSISEASGTKDRFRCPVCNSSNIKERVTKLPKWRCGTGHLFDDPVPETVPVTLYEARYAETFVSLGNQISAEQIRSAAPRPNDQLAIEEVDPSHVARAIVAAGAAAESLLAYYLQALCPDPDRAPLSEPDTPDSTGSYQPGFADQRDRILRSIAVRKGQAKFRKGLIRQYGASCMLSGCALTDIVDAAHIWPYRGADDNNPENGLLLRSDLHTLFDLDLLGIEPHGLQIMLHPSVAAAGYATFSGRQLTCAGTFRPSLAALQLRWAAYLARRDAAV